MVFKKYRVTLSYTIIIFFVIILLLVIKLSS